MANNHVEERWSACTPTAWTPKMANNHAEERLSSIPPPLPKSFTQCTRPMLKSPLKGLLDQAQARSPFTPPFLGVIRVG